MPSRHSDRSARTVSTGRLPMRHTVRGLSSVPTMPTPLTGEPVPLPRQLRDYLLDAKNTPGRPLSSSALPQTPNPIFPILFATMPQVLIPSAQITSGPFHILSPLVLPLLPQPRSPLLEPPSLLVLEVLIFLSLPSPVRFLRRRRQQHHQRPLLSALPIVLFMAEERPRSSTPRNLLHSLFHPLQLSLPILPPHGLDTVFPQTPRQDLPQLKVPSVLSPLSLTYLAPLLDPPFRHPHMDEICLLVAKAA
jgi:hypothetical protein